MSAHKTKAGELISKFLDERFNMVINRQINANEEADIIDQRDVYYECQKRYKKLYPSEKTFDLAHKSSEELQRALDKIIKRYCEHKMTFFIEHPEEFPTDLDKEVLKYWGIFRKKGLGIRAKERATAFGFSGDFPILEKNRGRLKSDAFLMLICEKETVGMKVLYELQNKGYVCNLIVTEGYSVCEIVETVLELAEINDNFYIFIIHDMEPPGYTIFYDLYQYFTEKIFSIGLNPDMARQISLDLETSKEPYNPPDKILKYIETVPFLKKWMDDPIIDHKKERIQLISNLTTYIVDYVDYIAKNFCRKWNLNRVAQPDIRKPGIIIDLMIKADFWKKVEEHTIGGHYIWTSPAKQCRNEFIRQNKCYRKDVTKYIQEIDLESQVLQNIVDTNIKNKANIKVIEKKVYNLDKFLEKYYWNKIEFVEDIIDMFLTLFWFCF